MDFETTIRLNNQNYLEIKSKFKILSSISDITEIFSLNKLFRYSKLIILDRTKTKKICVILQNPSNDDLNLLSNYRRIIKLIVEQDDNINCIIIINLFARIASNIKKWENIDQLIDQDEKNNMIYMKNNIFNSESNYDKYYLGYGKKHNSLELCFLNKLIKIIIFINLSTYTIYV